MSGASFPCCQRGPQAPVFSFLQGVQGQFVDRTSEDQLRQDKELLLEEQLKNQVIIKQKSERLE
jgi:adenylate cyclase